jgi:hypothetical protein
MQHHGTSHGHDVSNGTLGDTILVVGSVLDPNNKQT